tara:strand:- start:17325 stop:17660 length:336 start_codon:yes stop_codon:yes gene_type:complete
MKLTRTDRKALSILGQRRPICDLGKDRYREAIHNLIQSKSGLAEYGDGEGSKAGWHITAAGRYEMDRVSPKGSVWCKWAESKKAGAGQFMADVLNTQGVDGGHTYLRRLGV